MAKTKKEAQIVINVEDKSIRELNEEIKLLEKEMQNLKVGTDEWYKANERLGDLRRDFVGAKDAAKDLQGQLREISGRAQTKAIIDLGKGLIGAFSAAQASLRLLGQTGNQTWDEMTAKAAQFLVVMNGLNEVSKVFQKGTLASLNAVGQGFNRLVLTVRASSLAMRTALLAIPILALVAGVAALIANWDKIIDKLTGYTRAEEDRMERAIKSANFMLELETNRLNLMTEQLKLAEEEYERGGDFVKFQKEIYELEKQRTTETEARLRAVNSEFRAEQRKYKEITDGRKTVKRGELEEIQANLRKLRSEKDVLEVLVDQQKVGEEIARVNALNAETQDTLTKRIKETEDRLIQLNARQFTTLEIYDSQLNILQNQRRELLSIEEVGGRLTNDQRERLATINAEIAANRERRRLFVDQLEEERLSLENQKETNEIIAQYNVNLRQSETLQRALLQQERQRNIILQNNRDLLDLDRRGLQAARDLRDDIVNFDLRRNQIIKERTEELIPSEVRISKQAYDEILRFLEVFEDSGRYESFEFFTNVLNEYVQETREALVESLNLGKSFEELSKRNQQIISDSAEDISLRRIEQELLLNSLKEQENSNLQILMLKQRIQGVIEKELDSLENIQDSYNEQIDSLEELIAERKQEGAGLEELNFLNENLLALENDRNATVAEIFKLENDLIDVEEEIVSINERRYELSLEIKTEENATNDLMRERTFLLQDMFRIHQQLQDFIQKYGEEINAINMLMGSTFDLVATRQQRQAEMAARRMDDLAKKLQDMEDAERERQNRLLGYERELADAGGERYDELLALIEMERQASDAAAQEKQIAEEELKQAEIERLEFERKAAAYRKTQAIVDGVIQTILATIQAMPNLLLSGVVATAGAIGVAAIASQPLPPKPKARAGMLVGQRHSQGGIDVNAEKGEFIVNREATAQYLPLLTKINDSGRRRMAEGGGIETPDINIDNTSIIDYDLLAEKVAEAVSHLPNPQVDIIKVGTGLNEVQLTRRTGGLKR